MWESLLSHPRGRLSTRKYISIATAFLVVCLSYILVAAPTAYAVDASWDNGSIVYQNNTYKGPVVSKGTESHNLPKDAQIYEYVEVVNTAGGGSTQKAHLIYFPSGTDPATATTASYKKYTLKGTNQYSNPSAVTSISLEKPPAEPTNPGTSSCVVEGIGWIVCPVTYYLAQGMDTVYGWVDGFLEVRPLATTQDQALYRAWAYMRTFANIAFIIAFLVIIYSQISNVGLSNYDIKKMLPRIVIAAILVNTSYWICAVAVDVFNILGYSVQDLFIMIRNSLVGTEGNSWDVVSWESFSALILSGGSVLGGAGIAAYLGITSGTLVVAGAGIIGGLVVLLLPVLLSLLFVILMTFLILAARQAIITILIVIAPLAFVAFLLPNTEKWFEKWRSTFFTLLLLFPAFSLVFGGAQLASAVIIQNATSINIVLLAMAVQVAPLLITPLLLKLGGGVLNRFAGIVNNPTKGVFDRGKNWARDRTEQNKAAGAAALAERAKRMGYPGRRPTSPHRGLRGRAANARMRLNPNNMAYARDYSRREREKMKSENEAMSEGLFTQTAAGRRVYGRGQDAHIQKDLGENRNFETYKTVMTTGNDPLNVQRRQEHHEALTAKGRGEVYENALNQHAERDLQAQINNPNGPLRQVKINADVDSSHAEFQKANVTAEGKATFKREFEDGIIGGRALRLMNVQTSGFEKEAAAIDSMLTKRAEADWERRSTTDERVQHLRLKETEASESYTRAEKQWQRTITEIQTQGASAPGILAPNNVEIRAMTTAIQTDTRASLIQDQAIESAKIVQRSDFANTLKADARLRTQAAGIDTHGQVRVLASAKKAVSEELIKATNNVYDTMEYELASDPQELERAWGDAVSRGEMSEVIAYARKLSLNAPGLRKLKPLLEQFTVGKDPLADDVMLLKEVLAGDDGFRNAGRDLEVWANNEKNPATDRPYADFAEVRNASGPYANITASRFARMNAYSQEETLWWLQQNDAANGTDKLDQLLDGIGDHNSQVWRELKPTTREQIDTYRSGGQIRNPN